MLLSHFRYFREYSLKVNKHVCNPEAILLQTHDFRFSNANFLVRIFHFNIVTILLQRYVQFCCKVIQYRLKFIFIKIENETYALIDPYKSFFFKSTFINIV